MVSLSTLIPALFLFCLSGVKGSSTEAFRPFRISFKDLVDAKDATIIQELNQVLSEVGMVSVTDIPSFTSKEMLGSLHDCAMHSAATAEHLFGDGTRRRTMASHSVPHGIQTIAHGAADATSIPTCEAFDQVSMPFRHSVAAVTKAFAQRLALMFGDEMTKPMLATAEGFPFAGLAEVVEAGEHLEHFHSYENRDPATAEEEEADGTIEWHLDQGLFLVFTPARWTDGSLVEDGFSVRLADGSTPPVVFTEEDELVILLGDGVNQYVNPTMPFPSALRALPHALRMPHHATENRVWYGRMVLPPASAVHPEHEQTFGDLRSRLIAHEQDEESMSLGCSSDMKARQLEQSSCEEGYLWCWHRCMSLAQENLTATTCEDQGLSLQCQNPRDQLWGGLHGDYFPGCLNLTVAENHTELPQLPHAPRDEVACSHDAFEFHRQTKKSQYDNERVLEDMAVSFQWSVDDTTQEVRGSLIYNGLFGWAAIGFAGPENNMHGSEILMALPGGDYDNIDGLDLTLPTNVREYTIVDPRPINFPSFRHWSTPATSADSMTGTYSVDETDCFTTLEFVAMGIQGRAFNLTGTDNMIWAVNGADRFVGYHTARGLFKADWANDKVILPTDMVHAEGDGDGDGHEHGGGEEEGDGHDHGDGMTSAGFAVLGGVASASFIALISTTTLL